MASSTPSSRSIYSVSVPRIEPRPRAAMYLVAVGSLLVLLEAVVFGELLLLFVGILLLVAAFLIYGEPYHHLANGVFALLLAIVSVLFGFGGFYIGALLAGIGGVLAIVWSPPRSAVAPVTSRSAAQARS